MQCLCGGSNPCEISVYDPGIVPTLISGFGFLDQWDAVDTVARVCGAMRRERPSAGVHFGAHVLKAAGRHMAPWDVIGACLSRSGGLPSL